MYGTVPYVYFSVEMKYFTNVLKATKSENTTNNIMVGADKSACLLSLLIMADKAINRGASMTSVFICCRYDSALTKLTYF